MEQPFLSIIIPVYNAQDYLAICLDRLLVLEDVEIILIDDESTDDSLSICQRYADRHPQIRVYTQKNSGPSYARNRGIEYAKGRYISFVDSDDTISTDVYQQIVDRLRNEDCDILATNFDRRADNGCVLDDVRQIDEHTSLNDFVSAPDCVWNVWRYIFNRSFLLDQGLYFVEGYHCAEDMEFIVRALQKANSMIFDDRSYYHYRVNYRESLTRVFTLSRVEQMLAMFAQTKKNIENANTVFKNAISHKIAREYILNTAIIHQCDPSEREQILDQFKAYQYLIDDQYMFIQVIMRLFGIRFVSWIIYVLKKLKQAKRKTTIDKYVE